MTSTATTGTATTSTAATSTATSAGPDSPDEADRPNGFGLHFGFRADIEGLRGLAVLVILVGAAAPSLLPGGFVGLDVFFVVSGFLVTGVLASDLERAGRIDPLAFYARRARRLLPAALLVLLVSLLLTGLFLPRERWSGTGWDAMAAGLYVLNWRLAGQDPTGDPSILRHYWALGVAEQAYLIWPLVLALALLGAGRFTAGPRLWQIRMLIGLGVVAVASFGWSVSLAASEPARAYLASTARFWELALGGGVALLGTWLGRLSRTAATALAWAGLAAVVAAVPLAGALGGTDGFAGWPALVPALGTAALLAGGGTAGAGGSGGAGGGRIGAGGGRIGAGGPALLLRRRPLRELGAIAYPLYLWHWPLLVVAGVLFGPLGPVASLAVVLAAVVPAMLTHRYVENPVRRSPVLVEQPHSALHLGAVCTSVAAAAGLLFQFALWPSTSATLPTSAVLPAGSASPSVSTSVGADGDDPAGPDADAPPGAAVLGSKPRNDRHGTPVDRVARIVPEPGSARADVSDAYRHDCVAPMAEGAAASCGYGDREATFTVALVGDARAAAWLPALQEVIRTNGWRLVTYLKEGCPLTLGSVARAGATDADRAYPECTEWNGKVRAALPGDRPSLVITTNARFTPVVDGRTLTGDRAVRAAADGQHRMWSALATEKRPLVVLRDTPTPSIDVPECVGENTRRLTRCTTSRTTALGSGAGEAQERAASGLRHVSMIDLNDAICPTSRCAPVIGETLVYGSGGGLTATYARTLAPRLATALKRELS
ncbi:hypothetical protein CIK06_08565 [Plantactinospora sp. KBS50]|nr:hypothetical protein CIK06_08565 [Plantactinospora sp. KBS50]